MDRDEQKDAVPPDATEFVLPEESVVAVQETVGAIGGDDMAKQKRPRNTPVAKAAPKAARKAQRSTRATKQSSDAKSATVTLDRIINAGHAKLVGIAGGDRNQYVNLTLQDGGETMMIRLYPVGFGKQEHVRQVRDRLVTWLNAAMGG